MPFDTERVRAALPDREVHWYDQIPSTMPEAARLAETGCAHGTVVGADEQTAGQGRLGRAWHSPPGAGLYFSVVLRIAGVQDDLPVVTLALGLAVSETVSRIAGVPCDLRWPNDVLIGERKVTGILAQLHGAAIIAGVGVNCNHQEFPPELEPIATSLLRESGRPIVRENLLIALLPAIDQYCELLQLRGKETILKAFAHASSYVFGRRVIVENGTQRITGSTDGLNPAGYLIVREDTGRRTTIFGGGVRPA
jgi:BirA family biotin operon repressor/biotin-[acetyl-CoA-carboxylase] ligase